MPVIRIKVRIGPVTLRHLENHYATNCEPWPKVIPKEVEVMALIDTGASVSIVDSTIIDQMGLEPKGYCPISGFDSDNGDSNGIKQYPNYEVGLTLLQSDGISSLLTIRTGQIVGHKLNNPRFQAMIGMDVLKHCHFHLDGPGDCFVIEAPQPAVDEISSVTVSGCP